MSTELGALAAALAKAQAAFPAVVKDKHVTITMKGGGTYSFDYAPLDSILAETRKPLTDNGLAVVQMLDEGSLITSIIHEGGGIISGRIDLPPTDDIKGLGSAITYLRRYAIQAALGIAAEDDDDGSGANGDRIEYDSRPKPKAGETAPTPESGLIGTVDVKSEWLTDLQLRQTPEGPVIGFRLKQGRQSIKVQAHGPMAVALATFGDELAGMTVTCWGTLVGEEFTPKGTTRAVTYQVLRLERMTGPTFALPVDSKRFTDAATDETPPVHPDNIPLFDRDEEEAIAKALGVTK
jgi:hypothetical protein